MHRIFKKQNGQVATEWVVVTSLMTLAMFAPIAGSEQSIAGLMLQSIRDFYANLALLMSLP